MARRPGGRPEFYQNDARLPSDAYISDFYSIIQSGSYSDIIEAVKKGVGVRNAVNTAPALGKTPAHMILGVDSKSLRDSEKLTILRYMIQQGYAIDYPDNDDVRPIHLAAQSGSTALVRLLLQHRASPNSRDTFGKTPMDYALLGNVVVCPDINIQSSLLPQIQKENASDLNSSDLETKEAVLKELTQNDDFKNHVNKITEPFQLLGDMLKGTEIQEEMEQAKADMNLERYRNVDATQYSTETQRDMIALVNRYSTRISEKYLGDSLSQANITLENNSVKTPDAAIVTREFGYQLKDLKAKITDTSNYGFFTGRSELVVMGNYLDSILKNLDLAGVSDEKLLNLTIRLYCEQNPGLTLLYFLEHGTIGLVDNWKGNIGATQYMVAGGNQLATVGALHGQLRNNLGGPFADVTRDANGDVNAVDFSELLGKSTDDDALNLVQDHYLGLPIDKARNHPDMVPIQAAWNVVANSGAPSFISAVDSLFSKLRIGSEYENSGDYRGTIAILDEYLSSGLQSELNTISDPSYRAYRNTVINYSMAFVGKGSDIAAYAAIATGTGNMTPEQKSALEMYYSLPTKPDFDNASVPMDDTIGDPEIILDSNYSLLDSLRVYAGLAALDPAEKLSVQDVVGNAPKTADERNNIYDKIMTLGTKENYLQELREKYKSEILNGIDPEYYSIIYFQNEEAKYQAEADAAGANLTGNRYHIISRLAAVGSEDLKNFVIEIMSRTQNNAAWYDTFDAEYLKYAKSVALHVVKQRLDEWNEVTNVTNGARTYVGQPIDTSFKGIVNDWVLTGSDIVDTYNNTNDATLFPLVATITDLDADTGDYNFNDAKYLDPNTQDTVTQLVSNPQFAALKRELETIFSIDNANLSVLEFLNLKQYLQDTLAEINNAHSIDELDDAYLGRLEKFENSYNAWRDHRANNLPQANDIGVMSKNVIFNNTDLDLTTQVTGENGAVLNDSILDADNIFLKYEKFGVITAQNNVDEKSDIKNVSILMKLIIAKNSDSDFASTLGKEITNISRIHEKTLSNIRYILLNELQSKNVAKPKMYGCSHIPISIFDVENSLTFPEILLLLKQREQMISRNIIVNINDNALFDAALEKVQVWDKLVADFQRQMGELDDLEAAIQVILATSLLSEMGRKVVYQVGKLTHGMVMNELFPKNSLLQPPQQNLDGNLENTAYGGWVNLFLVKYLQLPTMVEGETKYREELIESLHTWGQEILALIPKNLEETGNSLIDAAKTMKDKVLSMVNLNSQMITNHGLILDNLDKNAYLIPNIFLPWLLYWYYNTHKAIDTIDESLENNAGNDDARNTLNRIRASLTAYHSAITTSYITYHNDIVNYLNLWSGFNQLPNGSKRGFDKPLPQLSAPSNQGSRSWKEEFYKVKAKYVFQDRILFYDGGVGTNPPNLDDTSIWQPIAAGGPLAKYLGMGIIDGGDNLAFRVPMGTSGKLMKDNFDMNRNTAMVGHAAGPLPAPVPSIRDSLDRWVNYYRWWQLGNYRAMDPALVKIKLPNVDLSTAQKRLLLAKEVDQFALAAINRKLSYQVAKWIGLTNTPVALPEFLDQRLTEQMDMKPVDIANITRANRTQNRKYFQKDVLKKVILPDAGVGAIHRRIQDTSYLPGDIGADICSEFYPETFKLLITSSALNKGDHDGNSTTHLAIQNGNSQALQLILQADPSAPKKPINVRGQTPWEMATKNTYAWAGVTAIMKDNIGRDVDTIQNRLVDFSVPFVKNLIDGLAGKKHLNNQLEYLELVPDVALVMFNELFTDFVFDFRYGFRSELSRKLRDRYRLLNESEWISGKTDIKSHVIPANSDDIAENIILRKSYNTREQGYADDGRPFVNKNLQNGNEPVNGIPPSEMGVDEEKLNFRLRKKSIKGKTKWDNRYREIVKYMRAQKNVTTPQQMWLGYLQTKITNPNPLFWMQISQDIHNLIETDKETELLVPLQALRIMELWVSQKNVPILDELPAKDYEKKITMHILNLFVTEPILSVMFQTLLEGLYRYSISRNAVKGDLLTALLAASTNGKTLIEYMREDFPERAWQYYTESYEPNQETSRVTSDPELLEPITGIVSAIGLDDYAITPDAITQITGDLYGFVANTYRQVIETILSTIRHYERYLIGLSQQAKMVYLMARAMNDDLD